MKTMLALLCFLAAVAAKKHCTGACRTAGTVSELMAVQMAAKAEAWTQLTGNTTRISYPPLFSNNAPCTDGFSDEEYPCSGIDLLSNLPRLEEHLGSLLFGSDIWGWTGSDGREVALVGMFDGMSFVDVTDPYAPVAVAFLPTAGPNGTKGSWWRDVKVYGAYAYIVADNIPDHGLQVVDMTALPRAGNYGETVPTITSTYHYTEFGPSHNVVINEETGFLYATGSDTCVGGLHIADLSEPASPEFVGCFPDNGWIHDAVCVVYRGPDVPYQGRELCFTFNVGNADGGFGIGSVSIVDVTNKSDIVELMQFNYSASVYAHQGWISEDHSTLLFMDEGDEALGIHYSRETAEGYGIERSWDEIRELPDLAPLLEGRARTLVYNISALIDPQPLPSFYSSVPAIDHNLYIKGSNVYQANYCAGLRVLSLAGLSSGSLEEVGYFDVSPYCDSLDYLGSWSVYPFFPSGNIVVSSIDRGLFVLRAALLDDAQPPVTAASPPPPPTPCVWVSTTVTTAWDAEAGVRDPETFCVNSTETPIRLIQPSVWWSVEEGAPGYDNIPCDIEEYTQRVCLPPGGNYIRITDQESTGQHGSLKIEVSYFESRLATLDEAFQSYCGENYVAGVRAPCAYFVSFTVPEFEASPCDQGRQGLACGEAGTCVCQQAARSRRAMLFAAAPDENCFCGGEA